MTDINPPAEAEEDDQEVYIDVSDEGLVVLLSGDWELAFDPQDARALADALREAADEAEGSYAEAG